MKSEFEYYAALSGLTPAANYSLNDHKRKYFSLTSGLTPAQNYSLADHERAFLDVNTALPAYSSIADMELVYFRGLAGVSTGSLADAQAPVFAGGGGGGGDGLYGTGLYGSGIYGQ